MNRPHPITITGLPGPDNENIDPHRRAWQEAVDNRNPGDDDDTVSRQAVRLLEQFLWAHAAAAYHNAAVPAATEYHDLILAATNAMATATREYDDLSKNTTINWLAAHHRFILASTEATDLLTKALDAATDVHAIWERHMRGLAVSGYEALVDAADRIIPPDLDSGRLNITTWAETTTRRQALTSATINGHFPAGYALADPAEPVTRTDDTETVWPATSQISVAVANTARTW